MKGPSYASYHKRNHHNCTEYSAIMENGMRVWKKYDTLSVDGEGFDAIGASFEEHRNVKSGSIGNAVIRLMNQRELVDYAVQWIGANRK